MPSRAYDWERWANGRGMLLALHKFEKVEPEGKQQKMLGWMIMFALIVILSAVRMLSGHPDPSARIASLLFAVLFLACVLTRAARGRAL